MKLWLWLTLTSLFRLGILVIATVLLTKYRNTLNSVERTGLGLVGGAGLLTIPTIWQPRGTPFEGWAVTLFTLGFLIYLVGLVARRFQD